MAQADKGLTQAVPDPRTEALRTSADDFDTFFDASYRLLVKVAMAVGASFEEAEDAANETMKYIYEHWEKIDDHRAYARQTVVHAVFKAKKRDGERLRRTIAAGEVMPEADDGTSLNAWEDWDWVLQHLRKLSPAQREVMACVVDGLSSAEIAALFGKNEATIRKNLQFARERLRRQLAQERHRELHCEPSRYENMRREDP